MVGVGIGAIASPARQVANVILSPLPEDARDPDLLFRRGRCSAEDFRTQARRALSLLTAQQGCLGAQLGRSPDDTTRWVLAAAEGGAVTGHGSLLTVDAEQGFGSNDR